MLTDTFHQGFSKIVRSLHHKLIPSTPGGQEQTFQETRDLILGGFEKFQDEQRNRKGQRNDHMDFGEFSTFLIDRVKKDRIGLVKSTQPAGAANEANPPEGGLVVDKPELYPTDK